MHQPVGSVEPEIDRDKGREHKAKLRTDNADRARDIVRVSGLTHAQVNGELNRLASVQKVSEATVEQLETRLRHADRWLSRL